MNAGAASAVASSDRSTPFVATVLGLVIGAWSPLIVGADVGAAWIGDFAAVTRGGLRQGEQHLGLVELTFDHVLTLRTRDVQVHASAQHVYGGGFSESRVGDLQGVSNIDADRGTRILEAWFDVPAGDAWSLKFGRYDLNGEFDVIEPAGLFVHSSQGIGADIAQTGAAGPSIFPRTALGFRAQHGLGERGVLRGVALDVESDPDGDYGGTPFAGGTMLALEYESAPADTHWQAGVWSFTRSRPAMTEPGDRDREYGAYAAVVQRLGTHWAAYARVGAANPEVSRLDAYVGAAVVNERGLLPGREDTLGVAVAYARNGTPYRDAMRAEGMATTAAETALELTWRVPLGEHLVLQPDVQYVIDPDTNPAIDDALVLMLRVELLL
jgi:porin